MPNRLDGENLFHTQGGFSVLTLLAFGDEKYYICTEIWEEPRLPPFFVTFPLKTGVLGALPGKICLPLIFICLPLIFICLPLSKTARREGKIGKRKVFPKVKDVNVESPKNRSNLLDFPRDGADGDGGRFSREIVCACVSFVFAGGNDELAVGNDESSSGNDESPGRNDESPGRNDELADGIDESLSGHDESPVRNDESTCGNDGVSLRFIASFEPSSASVM